MTIKLGDAGTIDHFGLAFQYQIKTKQKQKNGQKQSQIKNAIYINAFIGLPRIIIIMLMGAFLSIFSQTQFKAPQG